MKRLLQKAKILTLKEPVKIPDIRDLEIMDITGEIKSLDTGNLFYFYPKENEIQIIPYRELIDKYYFKPIIPLFHLNRRKVRKKIKDIWDLENLRPRVFIAETLFLNVVEERIVKIQQYDTFARGVISLEREMMNIAKTDFFAPPLSKYTFNIDWKVIDNVRFTGYHILENAISKKHQYLIRPKILIEQYDYPIDVFDKTHTAIAYVKSLEIDNFSKLWSIPVLREEDIFCPPNAFIFIRNLKEVMEDFKDTILHELAHFVEYRILKTRLNHNETFYKIVRFLNKGYKTSYIERRFSNGKY